ncbi:TonB-dependent receptor domain-containing protein [Pedobacter borealis]|uniref:TonB-dependent receptor domain-containing protein n=1 Tax=Pedobacter borealis TaxID=475254 RepID=UPI000493332F|nr:TonB-dependent receptor [Pedobacter borealis]
MNKKFTFLLNFIAFFLFLAGNTMAQSKNGSVSGSIKTSDGNPASYVSVGLKNTGKTTQTNEKGNFTIKNVTPGTYTIKTSAIGVSAQEKSITVAAGQTVNADFTIAESSSQLDEVAINGYKTPNRKPVNLGKIAIAPMDLPQAVQVIGRQIIADQQVNSLGDVMKNINGVALGANRGAVGENFFARGYSLGSNNIFKNGARTTIGGSPEASTLESVEVLKGSAALLYGGVTGGAVVNMVTKKPKFENGGEVSMRTGSYDQYKPMVDLYGPISKKLAFRAISTYENAGSFRDYVKSNRFYINPSLLYKISEQTEILVQGDYLKSNMTPDFGVGTVENQIADIGRNAFVNAPWAYNKTNTATAQLNINHKFNDNWKLNILANAQSYNRNYFSAERPFADTKVSTNPLPYGIALRNVTRSKTREFTYNEQINLNGYFKTGSISHTLLVGADADQSRTTSGGFTYGNNNATTFNYGTVNLLDPSTYFGSGIEPNVNVVSEVFAPLYRMGTFVQDLVSITDKFKILAGIRYTFQKTPRTVTTNLATGVQTLSINSLNKSKVESAFTPKFGLIYQPLKTTSVYASYSSNFVQNTGTDINLAPLAPSTLQQYEAGVKNDLFKGRLSVNLTWYRIANDKFAQQALINAKGAPNGDANIKELNGKSLSNGLELDITGTIIKGLNFIAGYSYNFIRYTETRDRTVLKVAAPTPTDPNATKDVIVGGIIEGQRLIGSTKNTANGTLFYTFQEGSIKGLKLGASAYYTGARNGGYNDTKVQTYSRLIPLSAFTTFDLSAGYNWKKLSLLAKVSNLTNELNYFVHENYSVNPIAPRQFVTTLSYKF